MLRQMLRIRCFEERLKKFYDYRGFYKQTMPSEPEATTALLTSTLYDFGSEGLIGGAVHLYIGQEAVAVGVCADLTPEDWVVSTHRGHGHAIAKGADLRPMLAELMGRETGYSRGRGGSMHIFSPDLGLLGGNGIVGAGIPLALGPAFAAQYRGSDRVAVGFFGEGGANQGTFHEALNLAALWELPVLFVCENNCFAASTPACIALATPDVADRAAAYGIPGVAVDGSDVLAVYEAASQSISRARSGGGPTLIECKTYRFEPHCAAAGSHNDPEECEERKQRDPLRLFQERLLREGLLTAGEWESMQTLVLAEVDEAEAFARQSPFPDPASLWDEG
jgi:pyruvate dehydrogenase E1 component alpha subunit